jgi:hypothetical protein
MLPYKSIRGLFPPSPTAVDTIANSVGEIQNIRPVESHPRTPQRGSRNAALTNTGDQVPSNALAARTRYDDDTRAPLLPHHRADRARVSSQRALHADLHLIDADCSSILLRIHRCANFSARCD